MPEDSEHSLSRVADLPEQIGGSAARNAFARKIKEYSNSDLEGNEKQKLKVKIESELYEEFCKDFRHCNVDMIGYGNIANELGEIEETDVLIAARDADYIGVRIIESAGIVDIVHEFSDFVMNHETERWEVKKFQIPYNEFAKFVPSRSEEIVDSRNALFDFSLITEEAQATILSKEYAALRDDDKIQVLIMYADRMQEAILAHYDDTYLEIIASQSVSAELGDSGRLLLQHMDQSEIDANMRVPVAGVCSGATYPELLQQVPSLDVLVSTSPSIRLKLPDSDIEFLVPIADISEIRAIGHVRDDQE